METEEKSDDFAALVVVMVAAERLYGKTGRRNRVANALRSLTLATEREEAEAEAEEERKKTR